MVKDLGVYRTHLEKAKVMTVDEGVTLLGVRTITADAGRGLRINGKEVKITHKLSNKDRIMLLQKDSVKPNESWLNHVVTSSAKRKIKDALK